VSDVLTVAIVGGVFTIVGTLAGAHIAGWIQKRNTQTLIESEFRKLTAQISGESRARFRARKEDWLLEVISDLLYYSDPERRGELDTMLTEGTEQAKADYQKVLSSIQKAQLILDPRDPIENAVNIAATELGKGFRRSLQGPIPTRDLLRLQDHLIEATRDFFRGKASGIDSPIASVVI
jgi:hypothetical protein